MFEALRRRGERFAKVVHPAAKIGRDVKIGYGAVIIAGAIVNTGARIGRNVIINSGARHRRSASPPILVAIRREFCYGALPQC